MVGELYYDFEFQPASGTDLYTPVLSDALLLSAQQVRMFAASCCSKLSLVVSRVADRVFARHALTASGLIAYDGDDLILADLLYRIEVS